MKINKNNQGYIIVFTLIMLAVFLTTALSFSYFILGDINKARAIDNSLIAYYSADAGMEESLYLLKNHELADSLEGQFGLKTVRSETYELASSTGKWNILGSTSFENSILRQRLYNGQSVKFFILNRSAASPNPAKSVSVEWYKGKDGSGASTPANLQVNLTQLTPQVQSSILIYYLDTSALEVADFNSNGDKAMCYALKDQNLDGTAASPKPDYLLELKVLGGSAGFVDRLIVKAYDASGCAAESYNAQGVTNLTLKSAGTYGKATQNIIAHILPQDPASGLLGFVLFSEQDVTKE